jgi:hypothetical protein
MPVTRGNLWCYSGPHTIKPLKDGDERHICNDIVVLETGNDLQSSLNALDGNDQVRVLKIKCADGMFDGDNGDGVELSNLRMPNLEEFITLDVNMHA